jgi:hypothetical protein
MTGLDPDGNLLAEARMALDYALQVQGPNGAFGYPFIPEGGSNVSREAAALVEQARKAGRDIVHKGWVIDDLNNGGLEFDNSVMGVTLLLAHHITGEETYLRSAVRAGDWALPRRFVGNINYNTLSAYLLARLYRVTGDQKFLAQAKAIFQYVALPTQMPLGRWLDQHNAKIQYHGIIVRHGLELLLALRQAKDGFAPTLEDALVRGLDNVAGQIVLYGSSNTEEMLATEALILAETIIGPKPLWREAINIDVNYLIDVFGARMTARGLPLSGPVALYLQANLGRLSGQQAFEVG